MKLSPHTPTLPMRGLTSFLPAVLLSLFGATPLVGQGQPQPGFRIHSNNGQPTTHLIDELGQTVHTWTSTLGPGMGVYVSQDGTLLRAVKTPGGYGIGGEGGGVQRLADRKSVV